MSSRRDSSPELGLETTHLSDPELSIPTQPLPGPAQPEPAEPALAPVRIGRFPVVGELGRGGMGVAYVAYDEQLDRTIALKLVRSDRYAGAEPQKRLLREAQALARVNHPNVVNVLEAGTFQSQVYVAMELVRGDTLDVWLSARDRDWRQVVAVFAQAGRGLHAVHQAGLVHRDVKPANMIVGEDGRVRILDFGIVSATSAAHPTEPDPASDAAGPGEPPGPRDHASHRTETTDPGQRASRDLTTTPAWIQHRPPGHRPPGTEHPDRLTQTGALLGTPAYMAPEQFGAGVADARSDQFSFCVSLYEGLYGARPFAGESFSELMATLERGEVSPEPRGSRVPGWVRQVVLRGLRTDPAERWPSMDALLVALDRDPARRRRTWLGAAAVLALAAAGVAAGMALTRAQASHEVCAGARDRLAGVWDESRRAQVERALLATGVPYAADTWTRAAHLLDAYAGDWVLAHTDACQDTAVRKEQSQAVLDQRMACLGQRKNALAALTAELAVIDATAVQHTLKAVRELPPLEPCADPAYLSAHVKPPGDPAVAAAVDAARQRLARATELKKLGKFDQALELTRALAAEAESIDYLPLAAEIQFLLGVVQDKKGQYEDARASLERAFFAARTARHDAVAVNSAAELSVLVGLRLARADQGAMWNRHARAELGQRPEDELTALVMERHAATLIGQGQYREAAAVFRQALDVLERSDRERGTDSKARRTVLLANLGIAHYRLGDYQRAGEDYVRARELGEELYGPDHPDLVMNLSNLGNLAHAQHRLDEAMVHYGRALALAESGLGAEHPIVAALLNNTAQVMRDRGDVAGAEAYYRRATAIRERRLGPEHPDLLSSVHNLGELFMIMGKYPQAAEQLGRALAIAEQGLGPEHPHTAVPLMTLGRLALRQGDLAEARARTERALAILEARLGAEHPDVGDAAVQLGEVAGAQGRAGEAKERCRAGLAIIDKAYPDGSPERAEARATCAAWLE